MKYSVGQRLRMAREAHGLSQRALALRSGVTNGMISKAEQDATSPSVASLKKILDGIPMSLTDFFNDEVDVKDKTFFAAEDLRDITPPFSGAKAALISLRKVGEASKHGIQMLHECYRPGADTGAEFQTHRGVEVGIVISGCIEVTVEESVRILGPGEAYLFESTRPHRFRNTGTADCIIVSACTLPSVR